MWSERLLATVTFQVHHSGYGVLAPVAKDLHTLSSCTCYLALFSGGRHLGPSGANQTWERKRSKVEAMIPIYI